jgi:prophage maintenance system killer protein
VDECEYLRLSEFLAIAEANTDLDGDDLADNDEVIARALSALWAPTSDVYVGVVVKAAILEYSLIRQRPLPRENVIVAHECMKEFTRRNGYEFDASRDDSDIDDLFRAVVDGAPDALTRLTVWLERTLARQ